MLEGPQIQFIEHRPGPNPMVLQVAPQIQIFRQVDRQFPAPSDQGKLSIGAQGGTSNQQSDRYSGSDSTVANTAIQQPSGAISTRSLGNYLVTSPHNAMSAIHTDMPRHFAMTATIARNKQVVDILDMATSTIDNMPLWILQRLANANIDPSSTSDSLLLKGIVHNASEFMVQRIEQGEELRHDVLKGVVGHVNGQGQFFF